MQGCIDKANKAVRALKEYLDKLEKADEEMGDDDDASSDEGEGDEESSSSSDDLSSEPHNSESEGDGSDEDVYTDVFFPSMCCLTFAC